MNLKALIDNNRKSNRSLFKNADRDIKELEILIERLQQLHDDLLNNDLYYVAGYIS